MPRTRSIAFSELKVGILSVLAMAAAAAVIFLVSGTGGFAWQRYPLKAKFAEVPGLKTGSPVRVAGVEVGTVTGIAFSGDEVEVTFELARSLQSRVTTASTASLGSLSLLGQSTVDVSPVSHGETIPPWGYVRTRRAPGQLVDVAMSATDGLGEATRLLQDLRQGRGTLGQLIASDELYRELTGFVSAAGRVTDDLRRGRGSAGRFVTDPQVYEDLRASLATLNAMLRKVSRGEGSLGRLLNDDALAASLSSASGQIDGVAGRINRGEGTLGRLVTDDLLYRRLTDLATRLDDLTGKLGRGEGSAGQLLQDKQLYANMNGAAGELRGLIAEIKKDPKKYLTVRVSLF